MIERGLGRPGANRRTAFEVDGDPSPCLSAAACYVATVGRFAFVLRVPAERLPPTRGERNSRPSRPSGLKRAS